jgi:Ala-tRNA(Pro) deacylase
MQELIEQKLQSMSIAYRVVNHKAVHTMEEMANLQLELGCTVVKNLFLRDHKGRKFFLVCMKGDKHVNLQLITRKLGVSGSLSFANATQLKEKLGLLPGSVTPLGILNDESRSTQIVLDKAFLDDELVGVHPNENTATVILRFEDLLRILDEHKNPISYMELA